MKKTKRNYFFILLILLSIIIYQIGKESLFEEGSYIGTGVGYTSEIVIKVTTDNKRILDIEVISQDENPEIANIVYPLLISSSKINNGKNIDVITGATLTSQGFIDALNEALMKAKGNNQ